MSAPSMDDLNFTFKVQPHFDRPRLLIDVYLMITDQQRTKIAFLSALIINRDSLGDAFHRILDEDNSEIATFSTTIFDKFGHIQSRLVDDEYHKGSGVWGRELNQGMVIFLYEVDVEQPYERKGIGSQIVQHFLKSEHVKEHDTVFCWPSPTRPEAQDGSKDVWNRHFENIVAFFRKNAFRRVGRTQFFAYSPDPNHPSRQLPISSDVNGLAKQIVSPSHTDITLEERFNKYPVHALIANDWSGTIDRSIRALFAQDPMCIRVEDDQNVNPISLAVTANNLNAIKTLIALGVGDDLTSRNPSTGNRPLDSCREQLESSKQFMDTFGLWKGYDETSLKVEATLKRAMGLLSDMSDEEYAKNKKYGCTCGTCMDGWLSPRMRYRLQAQAEFSYDSMWMTMDMFQRGKPIDPASLIDSEHDYLPLHLRENIYKMFYSGFRNLFLVVAQIIKEGIPTVQNMQLNVWTPNEYVDFRSVRFYIDKGGRIEYVLDCVTSLAREQSADTGDGTFDEMMAEDLGQGPGGDELPWRGLPRCTNDVEFDLVRGMLGLDQTSVWGPYYTAAERFGFGDEPEDDGMYDSGSDI